ncbi:MAG TPA: neutral zinc metallopeptidase [Gemmatimonadaceae bacterium]
MTMLSSLRNRAGAAAFAVGALAPINKVKDAPVRVTSADVAWSNEKIAQAYGALIDMWTKDFNQIGERFVAPRIVRYEGSARTECGVIRPNNAQYCSAANKIYYDEVFVAGMAKVAANQLHTDGDMTGIGIIAHETGHAVAMQLGHRSRDSYDNESTADCLAGAFAYQAKRDKTLEDGDMEEALLGMEMAGDPEPQATGNDHYDAMVARRIAQQSHGTKEQRVQNFQDGFRGGPAACLDEFRSLRS